MEMLLLTFFELSQSSQYLQTLFSFIRSKFVVGKIDLNFLGMI